MSDPRPLGDGRNVLCRAFMDLGIDSDIASTESQVAIRRPRARLMVNGVKHRGVGADGERFRVVVADVERTRVVVVVPAVQEEISVELSQR